MSGDDKRRNTSDVKEWIDWKELLFFHLRHPTLGGAVKEQITVAEPRLHITGTGETLQSILEQYRSTAAGVFDVDQLLAANRYLAPYCGSNFILPPGTFVIIPDQRVIWRMPDPNPANRAWWRPILETGDYQAMERHAAWNDKQTRRCVIIDYYCLKWVHRDVVQKIADDGGALRKTLEGRYQKVWSTGSTAT
jgi:hypothetical protein